MSYEHDDNPKAFLRLMQMKEQMISGKKPTKSNSDRVYEKKASKPETKSQEKAEPTNTLTKTSASAQSKAMIWNQPKQISAKRKAYLKKRDEKKKEKKTLAAQEREYRLNGRTGVVKHVRDVVQEPPKALVQPKKVFKREINKESGDSDSELPSDFEDYDLEEEQ